MRLSFGRQKMSSGHLVSVLRLPALALAHNDGVVREVHVLDAQLQSFAQPQAGAVKQLRKEQRLAFEVTEHDGHFVAAEDHGQEAFDPRPADFLHPWQVHTQYLGVREQRRQGLLVRSRRDLPLTGLLGQKRLDFRAAQIFRVLPAMKANERFAPMHINIFSTHAECKYRIRSRN